MENTIKMYGSITLNKDLVFWNYKKMLIIHGPAVYLHKLEEIPTYTLIPPFLKSIFVKLTKLLYKRE